MRGDYVYQGLKPAVIVFEPDDLSEVFGEHAAEVQEIVEAKQQAKLEREREKKNLRGQVLSDTVEEARQEEEPAAPEEQETCRNSEKASPPK